MSSQLRLPMGKDWRQTLESWSAELCSLKFLTEQDYTPWQRFDPVITASGSLVPANFLIRRCAWRKELHSVRVELDIILDYTGTASNEVYISNLPIVPRFNSNLPDSVGHANCYIGYARIVNNNVEEIGKAFCRDGENRIVVTRGANNNFTIIANQRIGLVGNYPIDDNNIGGVD